MVIGHSRKFPSALIVPNFDALRDYCQHKGIKYTTDAEMVVNDKIVDKLNREVEQANNNFAQWEKIKKIKILPNEWTVEAGELTAKLSLKRKIIENHYEQEIEGIYQD